VTASKIAPNLELLKKQLKCTNLFEDFDPLAQAMETKKYSLNSRAQITMKP
jgi:hypothetical protein